MARKPRIHYSGALYHVIARGNRRQKIFLQDGDYSMYLRFLKEYKQQCRFLLYAYILMPDHVHFLIEVAETPLARLMQSLQLRYSRNFNLKYNKKGHLFQGRYQAILCQKDAYLLELSAYIHLNGVRSGLVADPGEYPWSSFGEYIHGSEDGLVDTKWLLEVFAAGNGPNKYETYVLQRLSQGHREDYYQVKDQNFLGSEEFISTIQKTTGCQSSFIYDISLPEIVSQTSLTLKIPVGMFYSTSRNRQGALGRSVTGYLAKKLGSMQIKFVADHFARDPVVISQGINKLERRLLQEKEMLAAITELERKLTNGREKMRSGKISGNRFHWEK